MKTLLASLCLFTFAACGNLDDLKLTEGDTAQTEQADTAAKPEPVGDSREQLLERCRAAENQAREQGDRQEFMEIWRKCYVLLHEPTVTSVKGTPSTKAPPSTGTKP